MSRLNATVILAGLLLAFPSVPGAQTLGLYDDFSSPAIDREKWVGVEINEFPGRFGAANAESVRLIVGPGGGAIRGPVAPQGELQLLLVSYGDTVSDVGRSGASRNRLIVADRSVIPKITTLQAQVRVEAAVAQDCSANATSTSTAAGLLGDFFNDGTGNTTPGDLTGDILGYILLVKNSKLGDYITAVITRCTDAVCAGATVTNLKTATFTRSWTINTPDVLTVTWDQAGKRFIFSVSGRRGLEVQILTYDDIPLTDTHAPKATIKDLRVSNNPANCKAGPSVASIDARFDNVMLNADALQ